MWPARRRMRFSVTIACCWAPPHGDAGTGCRFVGAYAPQNYSVTDSKVCEDGKFVGLAIDEADSEAVSSEHLKQWIAVLKEEGV